MKIVALICARGNSRGIKNKNRELQDPNVVDLERELENILGSLSNTH